MTVPLEEQFVEAAELRARSRRPLRAGQEAALISKALARLSPRSRRSSILSRFQNLKYREIAELLDCPIGTVKGLVHRAIQELGEIYDGLHKETCRHEM